MRARPRERPTSRSVSATSETAFDRNSSASRSTCAEFPDWLARVAISSLTSASICDLTFSCCTSRRASSAASLLSCIPVSPYLFTLGSDKPTLELEQQPESSHWLLGPGRRFRLLVTGGYNEGELQIQ